MVRYVHVHIHTYKASYGIYMFIIRMYAYVCSATNTEYFVLWGQMTWIERHTREKKGKGPGKFAIMK